MHDDHVIGDAHDQLDIVLDQQHRDTAGERLDQRVDLRRLGRRHPLRRLIEHQELGRERHAQRNLDPALVTVGEIAHELVRPVVEPEFLEYLVGASRGSGQTIQPDEKAGAVLETLTCEP